MRSFLATLVVFVALLSARDADAAAARIAGDVSLGLGLGDPTALDIKLWTTQDSGFDLGFGLERFDDVFGVYGEYEVGLLAFMLGDDGGRGAFYVGLGGAVAIDDDLASVAVIIPIGLDFRFAAPIDLFVEARPGIGIAHRPAFGIGGQLGVRYRI
jgi:hypothetical protein